MKPRTLNAAVLLSPAALLSPATLLSLCLALGLTLTAVPVRAQQTTGQMLTANMRDDGGTKQLRVGDSITVRLDAVRDGGQSWQITSFNQVPLRLVSNDQEPKPTSGYIGDMGSQAFQFLAIRGGTAQLGFDLVGTKTGNQNTARVGKSLKHYSLTVTVGGGGSLLPAGGAVNALTDSDNGKSFTIKRGEVIQVKLSGDNTNNYSWQLASGARVLARLSDGPRFIQPTTRQANGPFGRVIGRIGGGAASGTPYTLVSFTGTGVNLRSRTEQVKLEYKQSVTNKVSKTFTITVKAG